MTDKLQVLILDDKRAGDWQSLLKEDGYLSYLDAVVFSTLENAINYLQANYLDIHAVLADFRLDGSDGFVGRLNNPNVKFENAQTAAMGANLTLLAEGLRRKSESECSILVNKLYTVEKAYLRNYSLESHLLKEYYFDGDTLQDFEVETLTVESMRALLSQSLEKIQQLFFSDAVNVGAVQRGLHEVLNNRMITTVRGVSQETADRWIKDVFAGSLVAQRDALRTELSDLLHRELEITLRTRAVIRLTVSALFPRLTRAFDLYCTYCTGYWADEHLTEFRLLVSILDELLRYRRDKTQEFGIFLDRCGLLDLMHTDTRGTYDESGRFNTKIIEESRDVPFNEIFGLDRVLECFNANYNHITRDNLGYAQFFKYGIDDAIPLEFKFSQIIISDRFLGFRLDEQIVEELVQALRPQYRIILNKAHSSFDVLGDDGRGLRARIYTDKNRLLRSVNSVLSESNYHAFPNRSDESKTIDFSFRYDKKWHCGKLIIEDNGQGMSEKKLGMVGTGGWADVINAMEGWVEDIWIISNLGDGSYRRSLIKGNDDAVDEGKQSPGTKVVFLFNLISRIPTTRH